MQLDTAAGCARHGPYRRRQSGKHEIIITEIPYQVNKTTLIERIAELVREDKIDQIADLRDESDQRGMSIYIELKRGAQPKKVLNQLYKFTALQSTFGVQMLALVDGEPRTLPLKRALQIFIEHRQTVIVRRSNFELAKAGRVCTSWTVICSPWQISTRSSKPFANRRMPILPKQIW